MCDLEFERYKAKLKLHTCGIDPYVAIIPVEKPSPNWPQISYGDIYNFLVVESSFYTGNQMKAYKSLEAYNYFVSGFVQEIRHMRLENGKHLLMAKVNHSQRMREQPLTPWVVANREGVISVAHCNCMAGLGEACSHVGALLFYVETATRLSQSTCTGQPCSWAVPTPIKKVPYAEICRTDFRSAKKKKVDLDQGIIPTPVVPRPPNCSTVPAPSKQEQNCLLAEIHSHYPQAAILRVAETHFKEYTPEVVQLPPHLPTSVRDVSCQLDYSQLLEKSSTILANMSVNNNMITNVERLSRGQSKSLHWQKYRAGRITASILKAATHTNPKSPSVSLLKRICHPASCNFSTEATRWGKDNEDRARDVYKHEMSKHHGNHSVSQCGFFISSEHPFMGASPDALVACRCCGNGVCEIKCPFSVRDHDLHTMSDGDLPRFMTRSYDGILALNRKHEYFYQVQAQMFIADAEYCDFVVWTKHTLFVERLERDEEFWCEILPKATKFFKNCVLPELINDYFSNKSHEI